MVTFRPRRPRTAFQAYVNELTVWGNVFIPLESDDEMRRKRKKPKPEKPNPVGGKSTMPLDAINILLAAFRSRKFDLAALRAAFDVGIWLVGLLRPSTPPAGPVPGTPAPAPSGGSDAPVLKLEAGEVELTDDEALAHFEKVIAAPDTAIFELPAKLLLNWLLKKLLEYLPMLLNPGA